MVFRMLVIRMMVISIQRWKNEIKTMYFITSFSSIIISFQDHLKFRKNMYCKSCNNVKPFLVVKRTLVFDCSEETHIMNFLSPGLMAMPHPYVCLVHIT